MYKSLIICFFLLTFSFSQSDSSDLGRAEYELYEQAVKLYRKKKYKQAILAFKRIEDFYPLSYFAMKAKLLAGISHYNIGQYSDAASDMNDYISMYSSGIKEDLPYVYYLRVISHYMQINKVQLSQQVAYKTLELATEYSNLFPDSDYIEEIKKKIKLIEEHVLKKDYFIGKFYLRRGEYLSAIKRFRNIESNKDSSFFTRSSNYLMLAYLALGIDLEAERYKNLLAERMKDSSLH